MALSKNAVNPYRSPSAIDVASSFDDVPFPIEERIQITPEVLREVHFALYGRSSTAIRWLAGVAAGGVLGLGVFLFFQVMRGEVPIGVGLPILGFLSVFGLPMGAWALLGRRALVRWLPRMYARDRRIGERIVRLTADTVHVGGVEVRWQEVRRWKRHEDTLLLYYRGGRYLILPTRQLSAGARDVVRQAIQLL